MRRSLILAVCLICVTGSIGATIAYALHLHGSGFRTRLAGEIGAWLGMDVRIGCVLPRSLDSRALADVYVTLPGDSREVFHCMRAVWTEEVIESRLRRILDVREGFAVVGADEWSPSHYRRVLEGSIGHDYSAVGLEEVRLHDIELRFVHPVFGFSAGVSTGMVFFDPDGRGRATLDCARLNGVTATKPVNIRALFHAGTPVRIDEVRVQVPVLPLATLGLDDLLGGPTAHGRFGGSITYQQEGGAETIDVEGSLAEVELAELTRGHRPRPIRGRIDAELQSARLVGRSLDQLALRGRVSELALGDLIPALAPGGADPTITLDIERLRWSSDRIDALKAAGEGRGIDLGAVSALLGQGRITGTVRFTISSLVVVDDELQSAELEIRVVPPRDAAGTIDRTLLAAVARRLLGYDPSSVLPEEIEYAELGARVRLQGGRVRIHGTHGPGERTLMTVKLLGRPMPLIVEPNEWFDVSAYTRDLSTRLATVDPAAVRAWWDGLQHEPSERP
jgi:hypothetical protein